MAAVQIVEDMIRELAKEAVDELSEEIKAKVKAMAEPKGEAKVEPKLGPKVEAKVEPKLGPKVEEFAPFPVKEQFPATVYSSRSPPPWPEAVILGFQHYVVMLGTTILIPTFVVELIGGGHEEKARLIQTVLFVAGINTLLQSWLGTRLPVVIGGSFTYLLPTFSIIVSERFADIADPHERFVHTMRAIQGALLAASSFQIIAGFCGIWRISIRFLSPLAAVPIVTFAGLGVFNFGFPIVAKCVEIGLPALLLMVALSQFNDMIDVIFFSPATVTAIIAYFLDSTLLWNKSQARRDHGWHWWEKFRSYKTDRRSEEFYALPYNLDKFFPSL